MEEDQNGYCQTRSGNQSVELPGPSKVGKDSPHFIARKAMYSKFPDDWKRKICSEPDNDKRLQLFESYAKQMKMSEEYQDRQLGFQRMREQHAQQGQQQQLHVQNTLQQRKIMLSQRVDSLHSNRASPVPPPFDSYSTSNGTTMVNSAGPLRQIKTLHPVTSNNSMKRVHGPDPGYGMRANVKRIKQEGMDPMEVQDQGRQIIGGQRSPGGTVYLHQKTADGQVRIVPATVVNQQIISSAKPLFVHINNAINAVQTIPQRKQNGVYRSEQGLRKVINNFSTSPLPSPASSSSSLDPESTVRAVPEFQDYRHHEQSRVRRIFTPQVVSEDPMQPSSPEFITENGIIEPPKQNNSTHSNGTWDVNSNLPIEASYNSTDKQPSPKYLQENVPAQIQQQPRYAASNPQNNLLDDLRKNTEYRILITKLRDKYSDDIKRIMARVKIDHCQLPKAFAEIMQILSYKIPIGRHEWDTLENRIQEAVDGAGMCYPLFMELKKFSDNLTATQSQKELDFKISLDPWNMCRTQFVHVPQFVLDAVNDVKVDHLLTGTGAVLVDLIVNTRESLLMPTR